MSNNKDNMINMTIRIDKDFKKQVDNLFKELGLNTTAAIMMFLRQCNRDQGLPFVASMSKLPQNKLEDISETKYEDFDKAFEGDFSDTFEDID